jgi:hypothetical protein
MKRLSPENEALLKDYLRQQRLLTNKRLCARFDVSPRTLVRMKAQLLDEESLAQNTPPAARILLLNAGSKERKRA